MLNEDNLNMVMDVKVQLSVKLGSCFLPMKELMELTPGTVLQLKQQATDPVGLYVNDKLVAYGEVVVVDDNFGIKVTEIVTDDRDLLL
ncbi:MAG: flagellar motor switch protein FliN [Puniceicoccaceae bacterium]